MADYELRIGTASDSDTTERLVVMQAAMGDAIALETAFDPATARAIAADLLSCAAEAEASEAEAWRVAGELFNKINSAEEG